MRQRPPTRVPGSGNSSTPRGCEKISSYTYATALLVIIFTFKIFWHKLCGSTPLHCRARTVIKRTFCYLIPLPWSCSSAYRLDFSSGQNDFAIWYRQIGPTFQPLDIQLAAGLQVWHIVHISGYRLRCSCGTRNFLDMGYSSHSVGERGKWWILLAAFSPAHWNSPSFLGYCHWLYSQTKVEIWHRCLYS